MGKPTKKRRLNEEEEHEDRDVYCVENHIYFIAEVNTKSITELLDIFHQKRIELDKLKKHHMIKNIEPEPIYLHITSYGGLVNDCFRAVDAIKSSEIPIYTIIDGYAASCGSIIAAVGKKRYMTKSSQHLMHQISYGASGKHEDIRDEWSNAKMIMKKIKNLYQEHSNMEKAEISKQLKRDIWWDYDTCLEKGLIDGEWPIPIA